MLFDKRFQRKFALSDEGVTTVKKGTLWTVIVNLVVVGGMGILYLLMMRFMDTLIDGSPLPGIPLFLLGTLAFLVLSFITHYQQYRATYGLVYEEVKAMRVGLAERLRRLPLSFFGRRDLADLTETVMGDVNRMEHVWSHVLGYLYGSYVSTAIIAVVLLAMDWRLAIACLWGVPVAFALLFGSRKMAERNAERTKAAALEVSDGIQEALENIREIRATNQEQRFLDALNARIDAHERTMIRGELATGLFVNGASVIMRLGVATTILVGANLIVSGQVDFMTLFLFLLVITRVYAPFDQSLALIAEVFLSQVSADRLMQIYDTPTAEGVMTFEPAGHDIVFKNVGFAYDNEQVLKAVSFTAKEGQVTALVGPSGSGKSTCARLAARLWDATEGAIEVGGVNIATVDPEVLLGDYSMVFQDVTLFDDTVMENIRLGKHGATDAEVLAAAAAANCDEFVDKLPAGYGTPIGENGAKLSGGERQRISIARALLKDAPIVLLDEATASLDVENETKVQGALSRLLTGKTVLVVAHRMRTVEDADKIVVLSDGSVIEEGAPGELLAREGGVFARMHALQSASAQWSLQSQKDA
ncbi:ABC transporter ATP-binding protein [Olsenella sp. Marseille-P4559]|uniref:ABC transporter ATP-binding protein n=1 Tax=Olsenella sp. Marseille-P4559 TaxID=2364795 RepID=UPI001031BCBE|nr:ABC transporter ATP-binding protein [Olsenella sp. Marseille-P4559]